MSERLNRKFAFLLLVCLIFFSIFAVKRLKGVGNIESSLESNAYVLETEIKESDISKNLYFLVDDELNPVEEVDVDTVISGCSGVLGANCSSGKYTYTSDRICSKSSDSFDGDVTQDSQVEDGQKISKDAKISLTEIVVPALLSGSSMMDSSVKQIYTDENGSEHWTLKPQGEMVSTDYVSGSTYPGDTQTSGLIRNALDSVKQAFNITYFLDGGQELEGSTSSNFTIGDYFTNNCEENCENPANPTPEKYSISAQILGQSKNYPGYYTDLKEEGTEVIETCDTDTTFVEMETNENAKVVACRTGLVDYIMTFVKTILGIDNANQCSASSATENDTDSEDTTDDTENECLSTGNLVIMMESPSGTKSDCIEGKCITEYNDLRNGDSTIPSSDNSDKVYVLTDCKATVEGVIGTVNLYCAWDIDYIAQELEYQSTDNIPAEKYPDKMDYINFQVNQSETESRDSISM